MAVYYQLSDGTNTLTFVASFNETLTRDIWDSAFPYVKSPMLSDQVTTHDELPLTCYVKAGTGYPYATIKDALAAIKSIVGNQFSEGFTLRGGDWNGSAWAYNSAYPFELGDGADNKLLISMIQIGYAAGESYLDGELVLTISCKVGTVF
ncbi:Uncharacterised protein [Candidatus Anstonella stagnisolia]|nr:Uncharacterised protein [Candidatus Anstonella stagnisolia]